jgi:hypothetical protein
MQLQKRAVKSFPEAAFQVFWTAVIVTAATAFWAFVWKPHGAWFFVAVGFFVASLLFLFVAAYFAFRDSEPSVSIGVLMRDGALSPYNGSGRKIPRDDLPPMRGSVAPEPEPNIVCIGEYDEFVILDEREVFHERGRANDLMKRALGGIFSNEPNPPQKISGINNVEAQIFYYSLDYPDYVIHRVHHGFWLDEAYPHVSFGINKVRELIIGVLDDRHRFMVFDNNHESEDKYLPLSKKIIINPAGYKIKARLVAGEYGDWCKEFDFELRIDGEVSFSFEYLTDEVKTRKREILSHQLERLISEGERFFSKPAADIDWDGYYSEAHTWRNEIYALIRENHGRHEADRFLSVSKLKFFPFDVPEGRLTFLSELYTQFVNVGEMAKEYRNG